MSFARTVLILKYKRREIGSLPPNFWAKSRYRKIGSLPYTHLLSLGKSFLIYFVEVISKFAFLWTLLIVWAWYAEQSTEILLLVSINYLQRKRCGQKSLFYGNPSTHQEFSQKRINFFPHIHWYHWLQWK